MAADDTPFLVFVLTLIILSVFYFIYIIKVWQTDGDFSIRDVWLRKDQSTSNYLNKKSNTPASVEIDRLYDKMRNSTGTERTKIWKQIQTLKKQLQDAS